MDGIPSVVYIASVYRLSIYRWPVVVRGIAITQLLEGIFFACFKSTYLFGVFLSTVSFLIVLTFERCPFFLRGSPRLPPQVGSFHLHPPTQFRSFPYNMYWVSLSLTERSTGNNHVCHKNKQVSLAFNLPFVSWVRWHFWRNNEMEKQGKCNIILVPEDPGYSPIGHTSAIGYRNSIPPSPKVRFSRMARKHPNSRRVYCCKIHDRTNNSGWWTKRMMSYGEVGGYR